MIVQWNGSITNTNKWQINEDLGTVTILEEPNDPAKIFSFEAYDDVTGDPENIDVIETQTGGVDGTIRVQVAPDPNSTRTFGARDIGRIDVRDTGGNRSGELVFLKTSRDVGGQGGLTLSTVSGDLEVGRDLLLSVTTDAIAGDITVGDGFRAIINTDTFGNLTALSNSSHSGSVVVRQGPYNGVILISGNAGGIFRFPDDVTGVLTFATLLGNVEIDGDLLGGSLSAGTLLGSIEISGDVRAPDTISIVGLRGRLEIGGDVVAPGRIVMGDVFNMGEFLIRGSISGQASTGPVIEVTGNLDEVLKINGSLNDALSNDDEIVIEGSILDEGAIAIDYDGWHPLDFWHGGATIKVDGVTYTGNTPSMRLWDVKSCRGDLNNDGIVDPNDPFDLALSDPAGYAAAFPGLDGSRVYHGDCNCNGIFGGGDRNKFNHYAANNCCTMDCQVIGCRGPF